MASETLPPVTTDQLEALGEEPQSEADGDGTLDLLQQHLRNGEIRAAALVADVVGDPTAQVAAEGMRWKQQITDRIFRMNGLLLLLRDFGSAKVREIDEATHCLIDDAFLAGFRPGHVVRRLDAHIEELGQIADREARELRRRYDRLRAHLQQRPSEDAERALARANRFLPTRNGLPTAKRFLDIADRALLQALGDEDLRALSDSGALDLRRVRPRADFPARILRPTDALQWLREEAKSLPSDFDREKVAELFRELSPIEGRIRTEPAAQRLKGFLGLRALGPASRASLGTTLAAEIELPRIPALRKAVSSPEAVELAIPLRPESTAVTQFLASLPEARTLRIVVLPGRREDLHPLRHDDRIAVVDVVDLLRIAESPAAERSIALQQVLIPQLSSKVFSPNDTTRSGDRPAQRACGARTSGSRYRVPAAGAPGTAGDMLTLPASVRVFVARGATDLRDPSIG